MASLLYDSLADDLSKGNVVPNTDSFKAMLVTSTYAPNKATHTKRSDVTNEVAAGGGYTAGGTAVTCTVAKDTVNHKETWTFSNPSWATATITARGLVIYKSRGGASTADELVGYVDFGADVVSSGGTFAVTFSTPLTIQN
jgi:hypothetical protein